MKDFFLHKLFILNFLSIIIVIFLLLNSFGEKNTFKSLQTKSLTLLSPDGNYRIFLGFDDANRPSLEMKTKNNQSLVSLKASKNDGVDLILTDQGQIPKVHLTTNGTSGIFLKNNLNKTVGSFTTIQDEGGALGLADRNGSAASLLRGGDSPSLAFFNMQTEPLAALGILNKIPHLLISGIKGNEGILIHGGNPNSMMIVDEDGKIKILISKEGVFQGKAQNAPQAKKKEDKIFSLEDGLKVFPDFEGKKSTQAL